MGWESEAGLERAEACIAAGGDFTAKLEEIASLADAHGVVRDYLGDDEAAEELHVMIEAMCVAIDRRRRAVGLSTTADEVA